MKNSWTKLGCLLTSVALLFVMLVGCQSAPKVDPVQEALGFSSDTVFATFNGEKITAGDYLFWLARNIDNINYYYMMMGYEGLVWDAEVEAGVTAKEYLKNSALETTKFFWAIENMAKDEGFRVSAEDKTAYQDERAAAVESLGGEEAYAMYLKSMTLTEESMERVSNISALANQMQAAYCREGGRFAGDDEALRSYMENDLGILNAKHILLPTRDASVDGAEYSASEIAA